MKRSPTRADIRRLSRHLCGDVSAWLSDENYLLMPHAPPTLVGNQLSTIFYISAASKSLGLPITAVCAIVRPPFPGQTEDFYATLHVMDKTEPETQFQTSQTTRNGQPEDGWFLSPPAFEFGVFVGQHVILQANRRRVGFVRLEIYGTTREPTLGCYLMSDLPALIIHFNLVGLAPVSAAPLYFTRSRCPSPESALALSVIPQVFNSVGTPGVSHEAPNMLIFPSSRLVKKTFTGCALEPHPSHSSESFVPTDSGNTDHQLYNTRGTVVNGVKRPAKVAGNYTSSSFHIPQKTHDFFVEISGLLEDPSLGPSRHHHLRPPSSSLPGKTEYCCTTVHVMDRIRPETQLQSSQNPVFGPRGGWFLGPPPSLRRVCAPDVDFTDLRVGISQLEICRLIREPALGTYITDGEVDRPAHILRFSLVGLAPVNATPLRLTCSPRNSPESVVTLSAVPQIAKRVRPSSCRNQPHLISDWQEDDEDANVVDGFTGKTHLALKVLLSQGGIHSRRWRQQGRPADLMPRIGRSLGCNCENNSVNNRVKELSRETTDQVDALWETDTPFLLHEATQAMGPSPLLAPNTTRISGHLPNTIARDSVISKSEEIGVCWGVDIGLEEDCGRHQTGKVLCERDEALEPTTFQTPAHIQGFQMRPGPGIPEKIPSIILDSKNEIRIQG
ncbi:hypothetical protein B0H17DRAFT_1140902 [Mycena rosella]|uniref:Uncharacterized protein n=1 Tax=Mycena rosella TaxID=1033263 RepID=A0AAD7D0T2_MYCRO|nr:hypothetical protein B0H17DRAFT_1140902 [Mycena rosella]